MPSNRRRPRLDRQRYGDGAHWVRPVTMFTETVERGGRRVPRFSRVDATG